RRARPTLRLIQEDLTAGWESPQPRRLLAEGIPDALHPLSELPHPIVTKAMESFGPEAANDNHVGPIAASTQLRLMEVKTGQWRGGVWKDPGTGVHWLVVAGLAKGGHILRWQDCSYMRRIGLDFPEAGCAGPCGPCKLLGRPTKEHQLKSDRVISTRRRRPGDGGQSVPRSR